MEQREKASTRFRRLLMDPAPLIIPGGFSPVAARMCETAGYDAFFLAGSSTAAFLFGLPDVGIMGREEMTQAVHRVVAASSICVFVDADTGYGNALNAFHAVQGYVRAGAAGLQIEDQDFPKRSGTVSGRRCISTDEAIGKFKAAMAAKESLDSDFVICARCDLIGAEGGSFEAAVNRCIAYVEESGVDLIWLNNVQSIKDIETAVTRIPGPVIAHFAGPPPEPSLEQLTELGVAAVLLPGLTTTVGLQATWELINDVKERGLEAVREKREEARKSRWGAVEFDTFAFPTDKQVREIEQQYLSMESRRDYETTFGHYQFTSDETSRRE